MSADAALLRRILRNDLRLFWRGGQAKKMAWAGSVLGRLAILALLHLAAFSMLWPYAGVATVVGGPQLMCTMLLAFLAMTAVHRSLEVLYNRGDLALLLASPVPARVVLLTRLVDIGLTSLLGTMLLALPVLDTSVFLFGWHWAWGYVAWIAVTAAVVPAAVLLTVVAVERLGARRARVVVQVIGIVVGMGGVLATQVPHWFADRTDGTSRRGAREAVYRDLFAAFDVPGLRQLAAAASGAWEWLLPLALLGVGLSLLAHRTLAVRFVHGAQGAAGDLGGAEPRIAVSTAAAWRGAFTRSHWQVRWRTQFLLLRRDPLLLMRCAMQVVSLVPMLFGALMLDNAVGIGGIALMAAAVVPVTLAGMLAANDDAREFVLGSPLPPRERAWPRAFATALPFAVLALLLALVVAVLVGPMAAGMVAIAGVMNAVGSAWLGTCSVRANTAEERARNRPPRIGWQTFVGMLVAGLGTGGVALCNHAWLWQGLLLWAVALGAAGLMLLVEPADR